MTPTLRHLFAVCLALLVSGCVGQGLVRDTETQATLLRDRAAATEKFAGEARAALDAGELDLAEQYYKRLLALDPGSEPAKAGLQRLQAMRERSDRLAKAVELLRRNDLEGAERRIRDLLLEAPGYRDAQTLLAKIAEQRRQPLPSNPELAPEFRKVISLQLREVSLKAAFEAIWSTSGINFILDRDVRGDLKVSIFVNDIAVTDAIDALLITQQLAKKVVSARTLFIYPKTPQKLSEYQDLVVRNFFLAHADVKQIQLLLKTILKTKDVFIDEKRNLVVIRDSQEGVELAEKLIRAHDQPDPEVMLALDVIEIKRSRLNELGISFANQIAVGIGSPLSLRALRDLNSSGVSIGFGGPGGTAPGVVGALNLTKTEGDTRLLANPRVRVRNREKAKIHVGDRLPIITTTSSATSTFVGQTVTYLDVGLKLEVEPQVMLDDDVIIKLNLEVSSATQSKVNVNFYDVGTRNTSTTLTIRDGETQILAGLIRDDESEATSRVPGLGDLPLLGRLFANEKRSQDKTEIILAITPRVLRNLVRPGADLAEYGAGTETGRFGSGSQPVVAQPRPAVPPTAPVQQPRPPGPGALGAPAAAPPAGAPATAPGGAPGTSATPPAAAPQPPGGVIPLIEFETPPGVGSPRGTR